MTIDRADLIAKAKAATPGPWRVVPRKGHTDDFIVTDHPDYQQPPHGNSVAETGLAGGHAKQNFMNDSAYIAACSPEVVLALCGEMDALERERDSEREARDKLDRALRDKDAAMSELFQRLYAAGVDCSDLMP